MTSLAEKYRPDGFDAVLGQKAAVSAATHAVKRDGTHSFLLAGPSGTGKTTLARLMANAFTKGEGTAANIEEIAAADHNGVDDMRTVVQRCMFRAIGSSPVRAIILDEAHRLTGNAWDVLLKATEEPPAHVYWFLCTTDPTKIPKTIHTRCTRIDLKPVNEEIILELLVKVADQEKLTTPDDILEIIAEGSGGSPRQALTFLESCGHLTSAAEARVAMKAGGQSKETIDLCRFLVSGRGQTWAEAMKYAQSLEGVDSEGIRLTIVNYISTVLIAKKTDQEARRLLMILECFSKPYHQSEKMGPLLLSLGLAMGLDK